MKILMVNKFLYPNGGSETYIFRLGECLVSHGHEVEYFGMEHEGRIVGNHLDLYTSDMNFHGGNKLEKITYPIKTIYSYEARKKIRVLLETFQPDIIHLNNFNYQLTPSIILEIKNYRKRIGKQVGIIFTAHDYQLICPNHMMNIPQKHINCEQCLGGSFFNCIKEKCIHGSTLKSVIGTVEAYFWNSKGTYNAFDTIICCSEFMKKKMDTNPTFCSKTVALHNFIDAEPNREHDCKKEDYVLYFGRYSEEKGIRTLLKVCELLPKIKFVFAGTGPLESEINKIKNITNLGFCTGEKLKELISQAQFSIYPSEWYENCPFSIMESIMYGTPVIGSKIGGIPELIDSGKTGELFKCGDVQELKCKIEVLWGDQERVKVYTKNCKDARFYTVDEYYIKLIEIYKASLEKR